MTKVRNMYLDLIHCLNYNRRNMESSTLHFSELDDGIRHLKEIMEATFDRFCEFVMYMLMLHLLDHLMKDSENFKTGKF